MNKYLKILMLSGGLIGAIAPTANIDKNIINNDLGGVYNQVEKMQNILPRLSRLNYKLNIDLNNAIEQGNVEQDSQNSINTDLNGITTNDTDNSLEPESNLEDNTKPLDNQSNVDFTATDEQGNEKVLTKDETINYLNETLVQTNIEYEQLKTILTEAIKDTMDYLESYKNGETTLTNEQKIYIKEHTNSIKFLAETLEDLSEDVLCCIDGCNSCKDDFDATAGQYLNLINDLESRINALSGAIASLQFVNIIRNPFYNPAHLYQNSNYQDENNEDVDEVTKDSENNMDNNLDNTNTQDVVDSDNSNNDNTPPTTFGLKSNIDTYAPTRRNIDTFFNTALYKNDYMQGYGYGMPYGGYGYGGYGMPYGGYGQPYSNGLNSNLFNRQLAQNNTSLQSPIANIDNEEDTEIYKTKRKRVKRAKNIDSYLETTVKSNVNTMGESKISRFFKEKFNNLRNKVGKHKEQVKNQNSSLFEQNDSIENVLENNSVDNTIKNTSPIEPNSEIISN